MPRPARRALLLLTIARARVLELDAEELEPLRRTSQLPAAGASDLIEVFTLRARVAVPSLFEEAVRLEHYALAFRNQGVSWKQASEGNGVVAVHYLPANASALLGFPDRNGSFPDASADVYVDAKKFDPEYWRDADYVGTIGGAAFAGLARELPSYATLRPVYKAVDPGAVDGGAFVLWCLETLAAHGATLTPLARLERRVPTLYVKNEEEKGDARAFAHDLSRCVADQQPESYDLSSLAATYVDNSAPLPRCLRNKVLRGVPFVFFVGASMAPGAAPSMWHVPGLRLAPIAATACSWDLPCLHAIDAAPSPKFITLAGRAARRRLLGRPRGALLRLRRVVPARAGARHRREHGKGLLVQRPDARRGADRRRLGRPRAHFCGEGLLRLRGGAAHVRVVHAAARVAVRRRVRRADDGRDGAACS